MITGTPAEKLNKANITEISLKNITWMEFYKTWALSCAILAS